MMSKKDDQGITIYYQIDVGGIKFSMMLKIDDQGISIY